MSDADRTLSRQSSAPEHDDYARVREAVIEAFNPADDDADEASILVDAIELAALFIETRPCHCTPAMVADRDPCGRCQVLGRLSNRTLNR